MKSPFAPCVLPCMSFFAFTAWAQPKLEVLSPANFTVARPFLHVHAKCSSSEPGGWCKVVAEPPDPGAFVENESWGAYVAGIGEVDKTFDFSYAEGWQGEMRIRAVDALGQHTFVHLHFSIDSSPSLVEVAEVPFGEIVDFDDKRILYNARDAELKGTYIPGFPAAEVTETKPKAIAIHDRATGEVKMLGEGECKWAYPTPLEFTCALTPVGALFESGDGGLLEYREGTPGITEIGGTSFATLSVAGDWAVWNNSYNVMRYHVPTQSKVVVTEYSSNMCNSGAANGDVAFWTFVTPPEVPALEVFRYREGLVTQLTNCGKDECACPLTDGNIVVYKKCLPGLGPEECAVAAVDESGSEMVLAPPTVEVSPGRHYAVNGGWIAFSKQGPTGVLQVWLRNPAGMEKQLSFFGEDSHLEWLGSDGEVMFSYWDGAHGRRCFASFDMEAKDIGKYLGSARKLNGKWYVMLGRTLFEVDLSQPSCAQGDECGDGQPETPKDESCEEGAFNDEFISDIATEPCEEVEEGANGIVDDGGAMENEQDEATPLAPDDAPGSSEQDDIQSQQTDCDVIDDSNDEADSPPLNGKPGGGGCTASGGRSGIAMPVLLLLAVGVSRRLRSV